MSRPESSVYYHEINGQVRGLRTRPDMSPEDYRNIISEEYEADLPCQERAAESGQTQVHTPEWSELDPDAYFRRKSQEELAAQQERDRILDIHRPLSEDEKRAQFYHGIHYVEQQRIKARDDLLASMRSDAVTAPIPESEVPIKEAAAPLKAESVSNKTRNLLTVSRMESIRHHPRRAALGATALLLGVAVVTSHGSSAEPVAATESFSLPGGEAACFEVGQVKISGTTELGARYDDYYGNEAWFPNTPVLAKASSAKIDAVADIRACLTKESVSLDESGKRIIATIDTAELATDLREVEGEPETETISFKKTIPEGQFLPLQKNSQGDLITEAASVTEEQAAAFTAETDSGFVGQAEAEQIAAIFADSKDQIIENTPYLIARTIQDKCSPEFSTQLADAAKDFVINQAEEQTAKVKVKVTGQVDSLVDSAVESDQVMVDDQEQVTEFADGDIRYENMQLDCVNEPVRAQEGN